MKRSLLFLLIVVELFFEEPARGQQKQIQFLSGRVFGGIFLPVFLEAMPKQYIDYAGIDARADGKFAMQVWAKGLTQNATVVTTIIDANKKVVAAFKKPVAKTDENIIATTQRQLYRQIKFDGSKNFPQCIKDVIIGLMAVTLLR